MGGQRADWGFASEIDDLTRPIRLGLIVWLAVAVVFGAGVERQQPLKQPVVDRERDHRSPRGVSAGDVAVLNAVMQDLPGRF
jgi:hypothetical protein